MVSYVKYKKGRAIQLNLKININLQLKMIKKCLKKDIYLQKKDRQVLMI